MKTIQSAVNPTAQLPFPETQNNLVSLKDNKPVTTSLQIAQTFGKRHSDVLRDVRVLECSKSFQERNFAFSFYNRQLANGGYKKDPMYYITRDGFTFLIMGFTGKAAAQFKEEYINAFNEMEAQLKEIQPKNFIPLKEYNKVLKQVEELKLIAENTKGTSGLIPKQMYHLTNEYCACLIKSFKAWLECENVGAYDPGFRDERLVRRFEAARLLYFDLNRRAPARIFFNNNFDL